MFSREALIDIRDSLLSSIERLERQNIELENKLTNIINSREGLAEKDEHIKALCVTERMNGISFKKMNKEIIDETYYKVSADVYIIDETFSLELEVEAADGKLKNLSVFIADTSSITEIKPQLSSLVKQLNVSGTLNAISSFLRMARVRSDIVSELTTLYEGYFEVANPEPSGDNCKITIYNGVERAKYVQLAWMLKWNFGKLTTGNIFSLTFQTASSRNQRLTTLVQKLVEGSFTEVDTSPLIKIWREIGEAIV